MKTKIKVLLNSFFPYYKKKDLSGKKIFWDKFLKKMGPVWRSSPLRRVIQSLCLSLFLYSFFYVAWPYAFVFTSELFSDKEFLPVDLFLLIDPLVGISTSIAGHYWGETLIWLVGILIVCILIPRMFCGYLCPLGTLIDIFDWVIGNRIKRFKIKSHKGWWVNTKYYILTGVLISSVAGVLTAGFVAAIPVVTRGFLFTFGRGQRAALRGVHELGPVSWPFYLSTFLFLLVFLLSLMEKRFWCRYVCPSGAIFSVFNLFRLTERKVDSACISCNKCVDICPFGAINEDFTTRTADCTLCQTCGGVCPTHSIQFIGRWDKIEEKAFNEPEVKPRPLSRRGFLLAGITGTFFGVGKWAGLLDNKVSPGFDGPALPPVRPPGSVAESQFNDLCIRCGECFKVCPGPVLQPAGLEFGFDSMWTPVADMTHAGCHQECNFCTQVCPTGAIQPLDIVKKKQTHMGLAKINLKTCLPHIGEQDCQLCVDECNAAGYRAIDLKEITLEISEEDMPPPGMFSEAELAAGSTIKVPVINDDACVGCGLCEYRCNKALVIQEPLLKESAIIIHAENEDRPKI